MLANLRQPFRLHSNTTIPVLAQWLNCGFFSPLPVKSEGQINLRDAVTRTISFSSPEGKKYQLAERTATLFVRPRGWHLVEKHLLVDGNPISGSLFDFGVQEELAKNVTVRRSAPG